METWLIVLLVLLGGAFGGLTNAAIAGELRLPHKDEEAKVFRPGWMGNVLVGGVAAVVLWGLYGPMAAAILVGPHDPQNLTPLLRVSELVGSIVTGIGGGRILTDLVEKQLSEKELNALTRTRNKLASALGALVEG